MFTAGELSSASVLYDEKYLFHLASGPYIVMRCALYVIVTLTLLCSHSHRTVSNRPFVDAAPLFSSS